MNTNIIYDIVSSSLFNPNSKEFLIGSDKVLGGAHAGMVIVVGKVFYVVDYPKNMMLYTSEVETCYVMKLNEVHLLEENLLQL
jgi:hypothetical protein